MAGQVPSGNGRTFLLFSGFNCRAIVAFCRELESCGLGLCIVALNSSDLIFKTKYKKYVVAIRNKQELELDDLERCIQEARSKSHAKKFAICPTSEFLNAFVLRHSGFFEAHDCEIPLVDGSLYELVSNKDSASELCRQQGVKAPRRITRPDQSSFPFVAKPRKNVGIGNRTLYPYLIFTQTDLTQFKEQEDEGDFYFEEFVKGSSFYLLFYLAKDGRVAKFSQQNLLQQPGGKSIVLARGASLHHRPVADRFIELLKSIHFHGLAMVELKGDENDWTFIELNPRFWGPFQLVVDSNSDIVRAFIGESLFGNAGKFGSRPARDGVVYFWFNGILESVFSGRHLTWHIPIPKLKFLFILRHLFCDIYLRSGTIWLFWHELFGSILKTPRRFNRHKPF